MTTYTLNEATELCERVSTLTNGQLQAVLLDNRDAFVQIENANEGFYRSLTSMRDLQTLVDVLEVQNGI